MTLTWRRNDQRYGIVSQYEIRYKRLAPSMERTFHKIVKSDPSVTSTTIGKLHSGARYEFRVDPCNSVGCKKRIRGVNGDTLETGKDRDVIL